MPVIEGASNVTVSGDARLYEIHGNAIINHLTDTNQAKKIQSVINLPRAQASHKDYETSKKSGPCFPGTRQTLLREMMDWTTEPGDSRMYVLSGLAGIGKSTVAYTIATQAGEIGLLGASFFFSRDQDGRNNAKMVFTTIAYQLSGYNMIFSKAIGDVLKTERGFAAATQNPQEQLKILILDPLRSVDCIIHLCARPILVVVDALDECDEDDQRGIVNGLTQLVLELPCFKVILTSRPHPHLNRFLSNQCGHWHKIFHLQDIEDKVVDSDIRLYLNHSLSLEAVQERYPQRQWCANGEEIDSLVDAAGRLFIIASTAVRYIFDKSASNPAGQMKKLLHAFARYVTPFNDLDHFYTIILRNVIPENCDNTDTVCRYQSVVGAIIFVQRPLPVSTLSYLISIDVMEIREVLDNLQSVILLGSDDVPRIYHKSFPDYLTNQARCKDPRLRIDTKTRHTQILTRCFEIMHKHLKRNILGLSDPARFMSNKDGLTGITDEQLQEKIPQELRYACIYWANHLETNIEDANLMNGLETFVDEHILHWFEVLSLIGKLDSAHHAIGMALKLLKSSPSDWHQLLSDALHFIGKFYELINRSALHTYYSALPFTPSYSLLYHRYIKEAEHNLCSVEGGPEEWDALVAHTSHGEPIDIIKFSLESTLFISCSQGKSKILDAKTGAPISTIPGHKFAVANDFSTIASSEDKTITFYNVDGSERGTIFTTSSKIEKLAFSSESSRVAAALSDGTVWLWDSRNAELINSLDGYEGESQLEFSPTGTRLAYSLANGIKLQDGITGRFIADLRCGSRPKFEFSGDGSQIASLSSFGSLVLYNSKSGRLIAARWSDCRHDVTISADGFFLATSDLSRHKVKLWSKNLNKDSIAEIKYLEVDNPHDMAFSRDNILAITTNSGIMLYDVKTHAFISTLPLGGMPIVLAFSPDCTRLAVGVYKGNGMSLWDIRGVDACRPPSKEGTPAVTALALSRDCSRMACGFKDGTVELWGTHPTKPRISPLALRSRMVSTFFPFFRPSRHTKSVRALGFDLDGKLFASGSDDGTIKLWKSGDGALRGTLKVPGELQAVALSNSVLVATWVSWRDQRQWHDLGDGGVTLWSLDTLKRIYTFGDGAFKVSIAENSTLFAVARYRGVELFDVVNRTAIVRFDLPSTDIDTMTFLPDNSQLVVQSVEGDFLSLNLSNKRVIKDHAFEHLIQIPNTPLWQDVLIWHCQDKDSEQHYFVASFSQHKSPVPVLWIPREIRVTAWTQGSSMIALVCNDGRIILLRLPTSHIS